MMSSKCLIGKGRWMLPQQCMFGKVTYKFAVIGYSHDPSEGCSTGSSASDQSMRHNATANGFDRQSIQVDKRDTIKMERSNGAQMTIGKEDEILRCVKKLFNEPNAQRIQAWPSQQCLQSNHMEGYGVDSLQRSQLKAELNGNVSYSYRTHCYLNR